MSSIDDISDIDEYAAEDFIENINKNKVNLCKFKFIF